MKSPATSSLSGSRKKPLVANELKIEHQVDLREASFSRSGLFCGI